MRRRSAASAAVVLAVIALVGCSPEGSRPEEPVDPAGIVEEEFDTHVDADVEGMPPECAVVAVGWYPGIDISNVENLPADWPPAPRDSVLCATRGGGSIHTAAYASPLSIDEVFAFYEAALPAGFTAEHVSGEENGTGYESLEGNGPGIAFQVRENDGGFTLAFAVEGS